jgi:predicted ArsR family transcriptional regulator
LASSLLAEVKAVLPADEVAQLLLRVADRTVRDAPEPVAGQRIEERLDQVAGYLTEKGYSARWENCDGHFELITCNCPYSGVAEQHPELCLMDQAIIRQLVPETLFLRKFAVDGANRCVCVFDPGRKPVEKETGSSA